MKNKKHKDIAENYEKSKRKHLEKLATKILKHDEKMSKLKEKKVNKKFLDLF